MKRMIGVAAAALALDVGAKLASARYLAPLGRVTVVGGLLELSVTYNSGMALGILSGSGAAIIVLPLLVAIGGFFLLRRYRRTPYTSIAIGLLLGGFLGNFIERAIRGSVLDMLYFPFLPWFVCNIADIAICAGVAMLGISLLFRPQDWRTVHENDTRDGGRA